VLQGKNLLYFGKKIVRLNYIDIIKNTYIGSQILKEIMSCQVLKINNFYKRLLITKYIIKRGGIYNSCHVNMVT